MATSLAEGRTLLVVKPVFRGTRDALGVESVVLDTESRVRGSSYDAFRSPRGGQAVDIPSSASPDEFQEVSFDTDAIGACLLNASPAPRLVRLYGLVPVCGVIRPHSTHRADLQQYPGVPFYALFSTKLEQNLGPLLIKTHPYSILRSITSTDNAACKDEY